MSFSEPSFSDSLNVAEKESAYAVPYHFQIANAYTVKFVRLLMV